MRPTIPPGPRGPKPIRIMLVDHLISSSLIITSMLTQELGAEVARVPSPARVPLRGKSPGYHLLILHQHTDPRLLSIGKIRQAWPKNMLPIIVLASHDLDEARALRFGANAYVDMSTSGSDLTVVRNLVYGLACERDP